MGLVRDRGGRQRYGQVRVGREGVIEGVVVWRGSCEWVVEDDGGDGEDVLHKCVGQQESGGGGGQVFSKRAHLRTCRRVKSKWIYIHIFISSVNANPFSGTHIM